MKNKLVSVLFLVALTAALSVGAWLLLFSTFMAYDDEGYVLFSLKNVGAGGVLYDQVYSQYGPFFFGFSTLLAKVFGFDWTNTTGRLLTLVYWIAAAVFCADIVRRQTRSTAATALTLAGVVGFLWVMTQEPGHPGGLITLLVAVAAWIGSQRDPVTCPWTAGMLGGLVAALMLTKINVGIFLGIAVFGWLLSRTESRLRQGLALGLAAGMAVLPWVLMLPLIAHPWAKTFAIVTGLAGLSIIGVLREQKPSPFRLEEWAAGAAGALIVGGSILAYTLATGTSFSALLEGVVTGPLRHPGIYAFGPQWRPGTLTVSGLAFALMLWRLKKPKSRAARNTIIGTRFLGVLGSVVSMLEWIPISHAAYAFSYGISLAPLFALNLRADDEASDELRVRQWLALLMILQTLHAFPVAGSQMNWGAFLWVPLMIFGIRESAYLLLEKTSSRWATAYRWVGCVAAISLALVITSKRLNVGWNNYHTGEALRLQGAEAIVLPEAYVHTLHSISINAQAHGDILFSLPGMFSFNLWTGLPAPTDANVTHWFSIFSQKQQDAIATHIIADPRAVLIVQFGLLKTLAKEGFNIGSPLVTTLHENFHEAFKIEDYGLWVRNGRTVTPLLTATMGIADTQTKTMPLEVCLPQQSRLPHTITLSYVTGASRKAWEILNASTNPNLKAQAMDLDGNMLTTLNASWDQEIPLTTPAIRLQTTFPSVYLPDTPIIITGMDKKGRELWNAPVIHRPSQ